MKIVFVILGVLVCAFCFAAGMPPAKSPVVTPANAPNWLNGLGARLAPKFDLRDIHPGCYDISTTEFRPNPLCVARISGSDTQYRFLKLSLAHGLQATALFSPLSNDTGITYRTQAMEPNQSQTVVVPQAGGDLTLSCVGGEACSVHAQ